MRKRPTKADAHSNGHLDDLHKRIYWCNTHNRMSFRCNTEGGIMLPCRIVDLLEHLELVDDEDISCVKLAE